MVKKPVLVGILLFAALVALIAYSTMGTSSHRVEVCMQFNGRTSCRTTSGSSEEFAERSAVTNACADIASGVTETLACERAGPVKVTVLK
jgi:hypothetical protein